LNEVLQNLAIEPDGWYIDSTIGGGGHTGAILAEGGKVLGLDQDEVAIARLQVIFKNELAAGTLRLRDTNFAHLQKIVLQEKISNIKGVLFDLGTSSYQIKQSGRGFSFMTDELLDMRMSQQGTISALELVNKSSEDDLCWLFVRYGEENLARKIAQAISEARKHAEIKTTRQLAQLVEAEYRKAKRFEKIHPATRVFQALRIAVNEELKNLKLALPQAVSLLTSGGHCCVISFHSLEDRIVKQFFAEQERGGIIRVITKKPITAGETERKNNPAARSAKMRVFEKI
jgi:16S rRNA (cytosine1402-N4)-methyltransferase